MTAPIDSAGSPPLEPYASWLDGLFRERVRVAIPLAAALNLAAWPLDFVVYPQQVWRLLWMRVGLSALIGVFFGVTRLRPLARRPRLQAALICLLSALEIELLVFATGGVTSEYFAAQLLLMLATGLLFPWDARIMALVCLGVEVVHLFPAALALGAGLLPRYLIETFFLTSAGVVASIAAHFGERARRREFDQRAALEDRTRELREATGNLHATVEQLRELDRVKSRFFANVSHELRTPLTVILAVVETLEGEALRLDAREQVRVLRKEASALLRLINDLLTLVELDAGRLQPQRRSVDLNALVTAQVGDLAPLADRRLIRLTCVAMAKEPLPADPLKLETVVRNLLSNALKFTPAGGEVRVAVRDEGDQAVLEVSDTGPGISRTDHARIFERFTRLPSADGEEVPGWGIGLALVREVTELHGGTVEVESTPGYGACFRVRLPRAVPNTQPELPGELAPADGEGVLARPKTPPRGLGPIPEGVIWEPVGPLPETPATWKVLVAEDHASLRAFLVNFLSRYYQVVEAADGMEALVRVRTERPDLVLADVMMPGLSGHELVTAIRADVATADTRVVLITAQRGTEAAVRGLTVGADDFLAKPFSPHELVARIGAQLRIRELDRSLAQAQKLATLGTLLAGLAHEIRNPVNVLVNGVPVLRRELPPLSDGAAAEIIDVVEESARRVARIVDDLLGAARREEANVASWNPKEALERNLKLFAHRSHRIQIVDELTYDAPIRGNPDRLDRVIMNLLDNAYREMEAAGGTLTVRCRPEAAGVRIDIEDTGPGISPEVLPRLFDPFFTTRRVGEGTGLGLHFCREIVQSHRGRLEARSQERGALFTLWLPQGEA